MTKSDLIDVLCETQKIPKGRAELLVQVVFESMEAALKRGERIEIRGFGSFELRSYRPYEGRNPRTGVRVSVQPKRLPFFKVGKELKERVNAGNQANGARARIDAAAAPAPMSTTMPATTTGPLTESGATAAAEPGPTGTPTRATA
ncbi:MAG TPA: HU family DNA-binding protein [Polyangia bacterium]|nr:HU family DNA-binding protein [Polyangia bacterium]